MYIVKPLQALRHPLRLSVRRFADEPAGNLQLQPLADAELSRTILDTVKHATRCYQRKKGVHEAIKTLHYGTSEFIVMAADTDPLDILDPLLSLAKNKKVPYVFVPSKNELGRVCRVKGPVAACSVTSSDMGPLEGDIQYVKEAIEKMQV
uniref:H/ACA ribonucleoprotein complex subunit 2 n=1 Tax=Araucaria cunninghamii TaxID=56994 RepID=A0A0D6R8Q7_ARACU